MTLDVDMPGDRPAPTKSDEIEITPKMIEAGIEELRLFDWEDKGSWIVESVFKAMMRASITEDDKVSP